MNITNTVICYWVGSEHVPLRSSLKNMFHISITFLSRLLYAFLHSSIKVTHSEAGILLWSLLRFLSTEEVDECHGCITVLADGPTVPLVHCLQHVFIVSILRQL
jgi:hypothetical protein